VLFGPSPKLGVHPASDDLCLMRQKSILVWRLNSSTPVTRDSWRSHFASRFRGSVFVSPQDHRVSLIKQGDKVVMNTSVNQKSIQTIPIHGPDGLLGSESKLTNFEAGFLKNPNGTWVDVECPGGVHIRFKATDTGLESGKVIKIDLKQVPDTVQCPPSKYRCMSPDGQNVWIGNMVCRGESADTVKADREGLYYKRVGGMLACWVGNQTVAEIAMLKSQADVEGVEFTGKTILVLWDVNSGKQLKTADAPMASTIEGSPDGKWIAEGGVDKRIRIRDARSLSVVREILAHDAPVERLKWHHSRPALVSYGSDQWIRIWDPQAGRLLEEFRRVDLVPEGLDISADGRQLAVGNGAAAATEIFLPAAFAQ
jgi:hypothetical protein